MSFKGISDKCVEKIINELNDPANVKEIKLNLVEPLEPLDPSVKHYYNRIYLYISVIIFFINIYNHVLIGIK